MKHITTLAWVCIEQRRLLMVRARGRPVVFMPGGKPEPGESDGEALARELYEELGVQLQHDTMRSAVDVEADAWGHVDVRVHMKSYFAEVHGAPRACGEIDALRWMTTADEQDAPPAGRLVLRALHARGLID